MQVWADFVCGKDNANVVALKGRIRAPYDGRDQYAPFSWLSPRGPVRHGSRSLPAPVLTAM
jgi:hypothetical protein